MKLRFSRVAVVGLLLLAAGCAEPSTPAVERHADITLLPDFQSIEAKVPANATLETILRQHELSPDLAVSLLQAVTSVFNPKSLRANQDYRIIRTLDGIFREFRYQIDADRLLKVVAKPLSGAATSTPELSAEVITLPKTMELTAVRGEIGKGGSLIGVLEAAGENVQLALEMANIFGGEIDFNSDLQPGDWFELLFERAMRDGTFAGYGDVKAAIFHNDGRRLTAIRSSDSNGQTAWYDAEGRSLKRQFLKSPLKYDPRITSRFSLRRYHPVHGIYRPHLGVDFGAPYGTAVYAAATGVVDFAGNSGEAGRMVRIKHAGAYQTAYLHLSSFAVRPGERVSQGDLIGRVGATGTATGPHLDYRMLRNGKYVDPIAELKRMPKSESLAASELPAFFQLRDTVLGQLANEIAAATARSALPVSQQK